MKIKESQLRQLIRESLMEYTTFDNNDQLYTAYEKMKEMLGAEQLLDELVQAMDSNELRENLEWIDRNNDLGAFETEQEEDDEELYEGKINPEDFMDDDEDEDYYPHKEKMQHKGPKKMRKD